MTEQRDEPASTKDPRRRLRGWRLAGWIGLACYVVALGASHIVVAINESRALEERREARRAPDRVNVEVRKAKRDGPIDGPIEEVELTLSSLHYPAPETARGRAPVILVHGSPSTGGADFREFAPRLAEEGFEVYAPDLPGFGLSDWKTPDYSLRANAHLILQFMDVRGIERAHLVGWSQGGGSCIWMAELAPERVASLVLISSVGAQETEGSGDYFFEHAKYKIGKVLLVWLPEVIPHFGLLGPRSFRVAWMANFDDSDQRPLAGVMRGLETPTLILHGRHDFLVPDWAAEEHHRLIGPSALVMLDAGHALVGPPFGDIETMERTLAHTVVHTLRHDDPATPLMRGSAVFAPEETHRARKLGGFEISRELPWWLIILIITLATFVSEDLTIISVALLIVSQSLDWGVGLIGCFVAIVVGDLGLWALGRFLGRRVLKLPLIRSVVTEKALERWGRVLDKHTGKAVLMSRFIPGTRLPTFIAAGVLSRKTHLFVLWVALAALLWTPFLLILTMLIGPKLLTVFQEVFHGPWAIVAAIVVIFVALRLLSYETTAQGRDRLKADLARFVRREFWPAWVFYAPLVPRFAYLALRHCGPMTFACANPRLENGGGVIGESKQRINEAMGLASRWVLHSALLPAGGDPADRARRCAQIIEQDPELGGNPVIVKPDRGYKGYGMHLSRSPDDLGAYFESMPAPVQIQRYHPGPHELGVLWSRVPRSDGAPVDEWEGEIFSATDKTFPVLTGDGKHSLEWLIWDHPRFRMQAKVFLKRFADRLDHVLAEGETMQLGLAGNHTQGAMFTDGMPKVTPALARALDEVARGYRDPATGKRFDFGRFDLRYESREKLERGEGFGIIELNGTASESTSMYDPERSIFWAYGLLFRHWGRLFRIGAARRREGQKPMSLARLVSEFRESKPHKPAERMSD